MEALAAAGYRPTTFTVSVDAQRKPCSPHDYYPPADPELARRWELESGGRWARLGWAGRREGRMRGRASGRQACAASLMVARRAALPLSGQLCFPASSLQPSSLHSPTGPWHALRHRMLAFPCFGQPLALPECCGSGLAPPLPGFPCMQVAMARGDARALEPCLPRALPSLLPRRHAGTAAGCQPRQRCTGRQRGG